MEKSPLENAIVLSHFQAEALLAARGEGLASTTVSPDLGLTRVEALISPAGALFPGNNSVDWGAIERIGASENKCFLLSGGEIEEVKIFSERTNRLYSLYPTSGAPTMLISGIPMHRIKDTDPHADTLQKIKAIKPISGRVLDTATGLGYTAIEAARSAAQVVTVELDPAALEIARLNPWSQQLFNNPRIQQIIGDSFDVVQEQESGSFTRILHDPPVFSLAGDLYSLVFNQEAYRILKKGGRMFHYIGDPHSKSGQNTTKGVVRRLREAGFSQVYPRPKAFGVLAIK